VTFLKPASSLLAGFIALAFAAGAPAAPSDDGAWSVTSAVASQYLFRGVRVSGASLQPSLDYAGGHFAGGVWSSIGLEDRASGGADPEVDFYGACTLRGDSEAWNVVPGFTLYTFPGAKRKNGYDSATFEPNLAVNVTTAGILLTPKIYYDLTREGVTCELTAAAALPLQSLGTELVLAATAGTFKWNSAGAGRPSKTKNWGDYWLVTLSAPVTISARSSIELGLTYSEGRNNFFKTAGQPKVENAGAIGRAAVTLRYTLKL
jgi:uncharacterized protein (TIGR02001 family)